MATKIKNLVMLVIICIAVGFFIAWYGLNFNIDKLNVPENNLFAGRFTITLLLYQGVWYSCFLLNIANFVNCILTNIRNKSFVLGESKWFLFFISSVVIGTIMNNYSPNNRVLSLIIIFVIPVIIALVTSMICVKSFIQRNIREGFIYASLTYLTGIWLVFSIQTMTLYFGV